MAKIVLDPEESAIETFAKLFFSATRNMGLSYKEACEALRNSIEAAENAPAEEKYDWYGSPANTNGYYKESSKIKCRKMRIGLIDVDGRHGKKKWGATIYPNLALGKNIPIDWLDK